MTGLTEVRSIAIVDDDPTQAETIAELVVDAGFEPQLLHGPHGDVASLIRRVKDVAQAAICDHRLSQHAFASFAGAEAAARLYMEHVPAVLVTQFLDIDADVAIRLWRPWLPAVLSREDAAENADRIFDALWSCENELNHGRGIDRRTQRCLIHIAGRGVEGQDVLDVFISGWHPTRAVRLPLESIPEELRHLANEGGYLLAKVNTNAEHSRDLFFEEFEAAPEPVDLERLLRPDAVQHVKKRMSERRRDVPEA